MRGLHRQEVARRRAAAALVGGLALGASAAVRAEHDMGAMGADAGGAELSVGLTLEHATYDNALFLGSYQGVTPSLAWMRGRLGASVALGLYHVDENGRSVYGIGDAMLGAHVTAFATPALLAGVALHVMLPTGAEIDQLGMGHVMVMPAVWGSWRAAPLTVSASVGYGRGLASMSGTHGHGAGPIVDPMNLQELTGAGGVAVDVGGGVTVAGRAAGAVALGAGHARLFGGARLAWASPRLSTGVELQLGVVGDPFTLRGVVDTALRF